MVSPLRKAREEVAVNIAVTGFVTRLLPTKTRELTRAMEELQEKVRTNQSTINANNRVMAEMRRQGTQNTEEYKKLAVATDDLNLNNQSLKKTITAQRLELRDLANANTEALNKVRGFGIAAGVAALTLGTMGAATVKLATDVRELEVTAFRANTTLQQLQGSARRFTVSLGDSDAGRAAAESLAEFHHQIRLFQTSPHLSNFAGRIGLFAQAGVNPGDLLGRTPEQLREFLRQRMKDTQRNPLQREALKQAVDPALYNALISEIEGPTPSFQARVISEEDQVRLNQARRNFGEFRVTLGSLAETVTVALSPAMNVLFKVINFGVGLVSYFTEKNQGLVKVLGFITVIALTGIGVIGGIGVAFWTATLASRAFGFSMVSTGKAIQFAFTIPIKIATAATYAYTFSFKVAAASVWIFGKALYLHRIITEGSTVATQKGIGATIASAIVQTKAAVATKFASTATWRHTAATAAYTIGLRIAGITAIAVFVPAILASAGAVVISAVATKSLTLITGFATVATWRHTAATAAYNIGLKIAGITSIAVFVPAILASAKAMTVSSASHFTTIAATKLSTAATWSSTIAHRAYTLSLRIAAITSAAVFVPAVLASAGVVIAAAIATKGLTVATWLWNAALYANPIVWIVAGVLALGVGIYAIVKYRSPLVSMFKEWGTAIWNMTYPLHTIIGLISKIKELWQDIRSLGFNRVGQFFGIGELRPRSNATPPSQSPTNSSGRPTPPPAPRFRDSDPSRRRPTPISSSFRTSEAIRRVPTPTPSSFRTSEAIRRVPTPTPSSFRTSEVIRRAPQTPPSFRSADVARRPPSPSLLRPVSRTEIQENVSVSNVYNIHQAANADQVAKKISRNNEDAIRRSVSSRTSRFTRHGV